jgi:hypothetical protein
MFPVVVAVVLLGLSGCGTDPEPTGEPSSTGTPSASTTTSTGAPSPRSTLPPGVDQLVHITVRDGDVTTADDRVKVEQGSVVQLRVDSDVADEIHLHGYDKSVDVEAGHVAKLTFTASLTGVYEVELESRALRLVQLQVQ